jgi:transcriptional regulator
MNKNLGPKILRLRKQGKTYNQIAAVLNCSKSLVCYHLGKGQKNIDQCNIHISPK